MAGCLFCAIVAGDQPAQLVLETPTVVGFLDSRPVFKGHTLLVPRDHVDTLADLSDQLLPDLFGAARLLSDAVRTGLGAQCPVNCMMNVESGTERKVAL